MQAAREVCKNKNFHFEGCMQVELPAVYTKFSSTKLKEIDNVFKVPKYKLHRVLGTYL
jgi:hypothetical protein